MATILATNPQLVEATSGAVSWQDAIGRAIRDPLMLLSALGLTPEECGLGALESVARSKFPLLVPREFVARMHPGRADDPLLRQVLSVDQESGLTADTRPIRSTTRRPRFLPGLLQKYASRALLVTTGACAVHCRYCFRREFPYSEIPKSPSAWQPAIEHIAGDSHLEEVILSGGDPLMLSDHSLGWLAQQFNEIKHIERLRIHTRMPVVIPQRVCGNSCSG